MASSDSVSEDDKYLGLYREALSNCEEQIIRGIRGMVLRELTKVGGLTEDEFSAIELRHRNKGSKAKEIVILMRKKDTLNCYIALSRLLCELPGFDKQRVFPFVAELEKAGKHPPIQRLASKLHLPSIFFGGVYTNTFIHTYTINTVKTSDEK